MRGRKGQKMIKLYKGVIKDIQMTGAVLSADEALGVHKYVRGIYGIDEGSCRVLVPFGKAWIFGTAILQEVVELGMFIEDDFLLDKLSETWELVSQEYGESVLYMLRVD